MSKGPLYGNGFIAELDVGILFRNLIMTGWHEYDYPLAGGYQVDSRGSRGHTNHLAFGCEVRRPEYQVLPVLVTQ